MAPLRLKTDWRCPVCLTVLDSHTSFRETGVLLDDHVKAKHPEYLTEAALERYSEDYLYRNKQLSDDDLFEVGQNDTN